MPYALDSGFRRNDKAFRDNKNLLRQKPRNFAQPRRGR
jgi:hypothetical protein